ncbi:unnamed protein product [marine sediment metagenome]|uniref:Uncharacterized protein n=1 Tax=marine sediment metagenome TaxID=412755 RepID=X1DY97_9ZZZZ
MVEYGSSESSESNAKISGVRLGFNDKGIMDVMIFLDYGGIKQGFGGYCLGNKDKASGSLGYVIHGILKTLEVDDWNKLEGQPVRVVGNHNKVEKIGHFLKDNWFSFEECFAKMKGEKQ